MGYGILCLNDSGELTFASEGFTFGYLGKATFVSSTAAGTDPVDSFSGYSTFTFTWGAPILCAIGLQSSGTAGGVITSISNSGSTWMIQVWNGNTTGNSLGFAGQITTTDIYVWGLPTTLPAFGLALYDASGNLCGDFSHPPLSFKSRIVMGSGTTAISMTGMTKPAVIGQPMNTSQTSNPPGVHFVNRRFRGSWFWDTSADQLQRPLHMIEYFEDDGGIPATSATPATNALLIEANGL